MVSAAVLIRTKDEVRFLPATLERLFDQSRPADEILIVDSGSTDGTLDIVRSNDRLRLVAMKPEHFTYGGSLNLGFESTGCEFVANLSAHAPPLDRDWLQRLLEPCENPRVVGVYGRQVPRPDAYPSIRRDLEEYYGGEPRLQTEPADHCFSNANSVVRRRAWEKLPFEVGLPYSEDQLWARTVIERGDAIAYVPAAAVVHSHNDSLRAEERRSFWEETAWRMMGADGRRSARTVLREIRRMVMADFRFIRRHGYALRWVGHSLLFRTAQSLGRWRAWRTRPEGGIR